MYQTGPSDANPHTAKSILTNTSNSLDVPSLKYLSLGGGDFFMFTYMDQTDVRSLSKVDSVGRSYLILVSKGLTSPAGGGAITAALPNLCQEKSHGPARFTSEANKRDFTLDFTETLHLIIATLLLFSERLFQTSASKHESKVHEL